MGLVDSAAKIAVTQHTGQTRKGSGIPYVTHCFEVMKRVSYYGVEDQNVLAAALLHDVIEDCDVTKESLAIYSNINVASVVVECSRSDKDGKSKSGKLKFLNSFKNKSVESIIIKIADRWCNVKDYLADGKVEYGLWYNLQAYPLYQAYFAKEHEVDSQVSRRIRHDIYCHNQDMKRILGFSLAGIELSETKFDFKKDKVDKLLHTGINNYQTK